MIVLGVGIDAVDVPRFAAMLERRSRLADRLFTEIEKRDAVGNPARLAARFAAKEAAMKALGVGLGAYGFHDTWIEREDSGRPRMFVAGRAVEVMADLGVKELDVSITHTDTTAQAIVLARGLTAVRPVLTVDEMAKVDEAALGSVTHHELVERAGRRVAAHARRLLGGGYGARVVVVAGKGSNGADGRVAARLLERAGAKVLVVAPGPGTELPVADLVIDAAYGTGLSRRYEAPRTTSPVLAVDIPSGIAGDTGEALGRPVDAALTVTFGAWKPGLLLGDGPAHAGDVVVEPIGLDCSAARCHLVEDDDLVHLPARPRDAHKWRSAVLVVGGQPSVQGAPLLTARAAFRAGAGYVALGLPGLAGAEVQPGEHVSRGLPHRGWEEDVTDLLDRVKAIAVGPGLGRSAATTKGVRSLLTRFRGPVVIDADGLHDLDLDALSERQGPTVLTPHEGELRTLTGADLGEDRVGDVRALAERSGAIVLLKGATTVVAHPDGRVLLSSTGSQALATAGTGDVLTGVIVAFCGRGADAFEAAAFGAHVHGRAAALGRTAGLVAGDLPDLVADWLSA